MIFNHQYRDTLLESPLQDSIGKYQLQYLAFSQPENSNNVPVLMLGGAFQSFRSFKKEVEFQLRSLPVILLDLPSQGSNRQRVPDLSLQDLADLLADFLNKHDINKINLIGASYGAALAALFASSYPQHTHKLIISGISKNPDGLWRQFVDEAMLLILEGRKNELAAHISSGFNNYSRISDIGMDPVIRNMLLEQIRNLSDNECQRYLDNSRRLLAATPSSTPQCPTLVFTGEFDHFTPPHENALFAASCKQALFAEIPDSDHILQFEKREEICDLCYSFLQHPNQKPITDSELYQQGVAVLAEQFLNAKDQDRRMFKRFYSEKNTVLWHALEGWNKEIILHDISCLGACFNLPPELKIGLSERDLLLHIPELQQDINLKIREIKGSRIRASFVFHDLQDMEKLQDWLMG